MDPNTRGARDVLTRLCRHRYEWPAYSCFTLVQEMAVYMGGPRPDVSGWTAGGSERAAAREAVRRHGSVVEAFAAEVAAAGPWVRRECDACTPARVAPGDVVLLRPGLATANAWRTVAHHVGLIGPECRPWVWTPPRPAPVSGQWGPPLVHMHLLGGDD